MTLDPIQGGVLLFRKPLLWHHQSQPQLSLVPLQPSPQCRDGELPGLRVLETQGPVALPPKHR